jgi:endoplasmic reticulum-Golgi intermediate compartment protein 2
VPTIYTTDPKALRKIDKYSESPSSGSDAIEQHRLQSARNTVFTNQYAVTQQSHPVAENMVPGVFVKYDIEPILLTIAEEWASVPALFIRLVNVVSGVLVAGGWCFQLTEWYRDQRRARRRGTETMDGILSPGTPSGGGYRLGMGNDKRML